jgi:restriction system protein
MAVPTSNDLIVPTVAALRSLGGSGRNAEIRSAVADILGLSEEDQQIPQGPNHPNTSRLEYRLMWARTYLRNVEVIQSIGTGLWEVTAKGVDASDTDVLEWVAQWRRETAKRPSDETSTVAPEDNEDSVSAELDDDAWEAVVIQVVQSMNPTQVERLFLKILREEGFEQLEHVGKPGDGGIDGTGVYRISLLSFKIYFQCKRYQSGIGAGDIRNFRGAMEGRGERGLFVTTSWFTKAAEEEATRAGARPVDLVDGPLLARLIAKHNLGVAVKQRDTFVVDTSFFDGFRF